MIVVFGSINVDLVARVARRPQPGETIVGDSIAILPGGKGANQALAARRAGADVALAGAVGSDAFAGTALQALADAGVNLAHVRRVEGPTGVALIHVDAAGENSITILAGANAKADPDAIPHNMLGIGTTVVMQLEVPLEAVGRLAARAHSRGARTVLNAAPAHVLPPALLAALDALIVNEIEADVIAEGLQAPSRPDAFATAIHRRFGCATVVTLGSQGALMASAGELTRAPAPQVRVIDSTGAGDAFTGAFVAVIDRGATFPQALASGVAAGSLACTTAGAQLSISDSTDIDALAATVSSRLQIQPLE